MTDEQVEAIKTAAAERAARYILSDAGQAELEAREAVCCLCGRDPATRGGAMPGWFVTMCRACNRDGNRNGWE